MIKEIAIKGFQNHLKTNIKLSSGVNVFVGGSNKGKSAIIRALIWGFRNRPQGDSFKNYTLKPQEKVEVNTTFSDKTSFIRARSKNENYYQIDEKKYKALRTDVPENITRISKMKDVNLQSQHPSDQYFLLTDTPGQVAKKFNKVAGLEIMDKAIYEINAQVNETNQNLKIYDEEIKNKKKELKKLLWVKEAKQKALNLKGLIAEKETTQLKIDRISTLLEKIKETEIELKGFIGINEAFIQIEIIGNKSRQIFGIQNKINTIINTVSTLKKTNKELKRYKDIEQAFLRLKRLKKDEETTKLKKTDAGDVTALILNIQKIKNKITLAKDDINKTQINFDEYLKTNKCPICGRR